MKSFKSKYGGPSPPYFIIWNELLFDKDTNAVAFYITVFIAVEFDFESSWKIGRKWIDTL
jgi:hypothetical protein